MRAPSFAKARLRVTDRGCAYPVSMADTATDEIAHGDPKALDMRRRTANYAKCAWESPGFWFAILGKTLSLWASQLSTFTSGF